MGVQEKQGSEDRGDRDSRGKATGDQIQAGGGASVGGNVQAGGDIAGRDKKVVQGDEVGGDKITVGDISDSAGIALGRGAQAAQTERGTVLQAQRDIINIGLQQTGPMRRASKWQIARPPDTYVQRKDLEYRLRELLLSPSEGLHLVLLYGVAGVGTGWLAQQVAAELKEEFPGGMLTADLQATSVADVLWSFVEPYDPAAVRSSLHDPSRHRKELERVLGDQKALLVLDHVESAQQARELLPQECPNAVVLFISRTRLSDLVSAENSLHVAEMTASESEELFRRIWEQEGRFRATPSETIRELARRLYYIPASMTAVARDILNRQIAPEDYLEEISSRRRRRDLSAIVNAGYEAVYDNLPAQGRQVLPFVGVVGGGIWRLDTLVFISQQRRTEVEIGLRQLLAAGLVQREMPGHFQISAAVRDFAVDKLEEIGGKALVAEAQALAAHHYRQTCQQVMGRLRRLLLDDFLRDEERRQRFSQALDQALAAFGSGDQVGVTSSRVQVDPGLGHVDLIQNTFETVVLSDREYFASWADALQMSLSEQRRQLEEILAWALEREDWPLLRSISTLSLGDLMNYTHIRGDRESGGGQWLSLKFGFGLIRSSHVEDIYVQESRLRATRIVDSRWEDCEFISSEWLGVTMDRIHFERSDIVGASMPGLVVTNSRFEDVDARGADLRGAVFDSCLFERVNFRGANLKEAEFVNCRFDAVDLRGTVFQGIAPEGPFSAAVSGRIIPGDLDLDMVGHDVLDRPNIPSLFGEVYRQIEARRDDEDLDREEIDNLIRKIEKRVTTGGQADSRQIGSWLKRLAWMDSYAFWLTASILTNPLTGIDPGIRWAARETKRHVKQVQEEGDAPS